ncbi:MAG: FMN-binding protein [Oscillospiraceae bacterium]|jgi:electron transport complex protein RnfG|nr:FMN-binding protein [Oscillospiraceae bacterium]
MKNKIDIKEIVISAVILAVIAGGVTTALAATNTLTAPVIATITEQEETKARQQVIDADSFEKHTLDDGEKQVTYYTAIKNGDVVGYVFSVSSTGKSSGLVVMTGISANGSITGVSVTSDNETAGYVDKVKNAGLFDRFSGKAASKNLELGTDIDGVSQATKTSKGVTDGVNKAIEYYSICIKEVQNDDRT